MESIIIAFSFRCGSYHRSFEVPFRHPNGEGSMAELTVPANRRRQVLDAHAASQRQLAKLPRQVACAIVGIVDSPPLFLTRPSLSLL